MSRSGYCWALTALEARVKPATTANGAARRVNVASCIGSLPGFARRSTSFCWDAASQHPNCLPTHDLGENRGPVFGIMRQQKGAVTVSPRLMLAAWGTGSQLTPGYLN